MQVLSLLYTESHAESMTRSAVLCDHAYHFGHQLGNAAKRLQVLPDSKQAYEPLQA